MAYHNCRGSNPRLENIELLFSSKFEEFNFNGIADRSLYHHFNDNNKKRYKKEYLKPNIIYESPASVPADDFILAYAYKNNYYILSNDRFLNYSWPPRQWIDSHRICFMIIEGELILRFPDISLTKNLVEKEVSEKEKSKNRNQMANPENETSSSTLDVLKKIKESDKESELDLYSTEEAQ